MEMSSLLYAGWLRDGLSDMCIFFYFYLSNFICDGLESFLG